MHARPPSVAAVLAVFSIFRHFPDLFPDAPDEIEKFLEQVQSSGRQPALEAPRHVLLLRCPPAQETDASTRRNAFVMVFQVAQDKAIAFISANLDKVLNYGDGFSLNLLELIRQARGRGEGRKWEGGLPSLSVRDRFRAETQRYAC